MIRSLEKKLPKQLKGYRKFWIHPDGYVFRIEGHKEIMLNISKKNYAPLISTGREKLNLVFLMLEYFGDKFYSEKENTKIRYKYKIIDGKIPIDTISIVEYNNSNSINKDAFAYKCKERATSANNRTMNMEQIDESDVYNALVRSNFRCLYCDIFLHPSNWELDHVEPLSKSGLNISTNLAASCKKCNRMKGGLGYMDFLWRCKTISDRFNDVLLNQSQSN